MKRQLGIADAWLAGIGMIVLCGIVMGSIVALNHFIGQIEARGYERGKYEVEARYAQRDNAALQAAAAEIARLTEAKEQLERQAAKAMLALSDQRRKEKADADATRARDVELARAGTLVLRDERGIVASCASGGGSGTSGQAPAGGGVSAPAGGCQLSPETAASLYAIVDDADQLARDFNKAIAVIAVDRQVCGVEAGP